MLKTNAANISVRRCRHCISLHRRNFFDLVTPSAWRMAKLTYALYPREQHNGCEVPSDLRADSQVATQCDDPRVKSVTLGFALTFLHAADCPGHQQTWLIARSNIHPTISMSAVWDDVNPLSLSCLRKNAFLFSELYITRKRGSAKHSVEVDFTLLREHVIFGHVPYIKTLWLIETSFAQLITSMR